MEEWAAQGVGGGLKRWAGGEVIRKIFTWGTVLQLYTAWSRVKM